jgi:ferredoxin
MVSAVAEQWRISVDRDVCQGTGMCAAIAARHFRLTDGYSAPIDEVVDQDDDVVDAAENCPVEAIRVVSAADGRIIAPEPY